MIKIKEFQEVWSYIVNSINEDNEIYTLTKKHKNTVVNIIDEGLLVSIGKEPKLVTKEWIEDTWNTLI